MLGYNGSSMKESVIQPMYRVLPNGRTRLSQWFLELSRERTYHLMILPGIILVVLFSYLPMYGILISFKNFSITRGILGSAWARNAGFEHFIDFFRAPEVGLVLRNTVLLGLFSVLIVQIQPMLLPSSSGRGKALTNCARKRS